MATSATSSSDEIVIPEAPIKELSGASPTGYARSKLIAERIIENAVSQAGLRATILRIGQIIPAPETGSQLWNPNEMIPLMIRSALTTGTLPDTPGGGDQCSWIDLDTLSKAIVEVADVSWENLSGGPPKDVEVQLVYNLVHPRPFSWKDHFLPALSEAGLKFKVVTLEDWLDKLRNSDGDVAKNPSRKLLGFWEGQSWSRAGCTIKFETKLAETHVAAMKATENVVDGDYVKTLLATWRDVW
jgi:thioester reductase-like protein